MRAVRGTQRGATVLEVLVALSLFAVVALAGSYVFSATFRAWIAGRDLADEQQNARLVLEWMVRRIRLAGFNVTSTAEYFGEAAASSMAFLADVDGDGTPEWHRF
ncbi:MAG: prepilin-type N-terminal cleavage/methylation domain-containing protein, partial [Armatimonadota bacterium]|nr:prepilin-type N-terminal cleavage/methylation domain-containing protein [Armatimonadota bacterium]